MHHNGIKIRSASFEARLVRAVQPHLPSTLYDSSFIQIVLDVPLYLPLLFVLLLNIAAVRRDHTLLETSTYRPLFQSTLLSGNMRLPSVFLLTAPLLCHILAQAQVIVDLSTMEALSLQIADTINQSLNGSLQLVCPTCST